MKKQTGTLYGKLALDLLLFALLVLMYQKRLISMEFHEIGGLVLFGLFLVHKALNWKWPRAALGAVLRKGRVTAAMVVDALLLLSMTAVLVTGLLISKTLPTAIVGSGRLKPWHFFAAALALALTGIHLGLHAGMLQNAVWKKLPKKPRTAVGAVLLAAALCFGTYSLRQTAYLSWLAQPAVILTAGEETPALASEHVPGSGAHGGKGGGKGLGNGQGKGQESPDAHTVSVSNVLRTAASYGSIALWFSILTAGAQTALRKGKAARKA